MLDDTFKVRVFQLRTDVPVEKLVLDYIDSLDRRSGVPKLLLLGGYLQRVREGSVQQLLIDPLPKKQNKIAKYSAHV